MGAYAVLFFLEGNILPTWKFLVCDRMETPYPSKNHHGKPYPERHGCCFPRLLLILFTVGNSGLFLASPAWAVEETKTVAWDGVGTEALLKQLGDASYRVRREAFLKLCDRSIPIDPWLEAETKNADPHQASLARWLIQLRKSNGSIVERLEVLSAYQGIIQGDESGLYRLIGSNQWERVIELLEILPQVSLQSLFRDQGQLGLLVEQAWESNQSWVVPRLINLSVPIEQRVAINRWWREIGMPDSWKVDEPNSPVVTLSRLENEGNLDEAIEFANQNGLSQRVESLLVRAGDWEQWLELQSKGMVRSFRGNADAQKLAVNLILRRTAEVQEIWERLKKQAKGKIAPGHMTLALALDDRDYFETLLEESDRFQAFTILHQLGKLKEAFQAVGLSELTPAAVQKWSPMLLSLLSPRDSGRGQDTLRMYLMAIHQLGNEEIESLVDDTLKDRMRKDRNVLDVVLRIWVSLNQRYKAVAFLKDLSVRKKLPASLFANKPIGADKSEDEQHFETVFGRQISEPYVVFEYLVGKQLGKADRPSDSEAIGNAIDDLDRLHEGRLADGWSDTESLKDMIFSVRMKLKDIQRSDTPFCSQMASILELNGDTRFAINLLRENPGEIDAGRQLARCLERMGLIDKASEMMEQVLRLSKGNNMIFLEAVDLAEKAGRYSEAEMMQKQFLSSVHQVPFLSTTGRRPQEIEDLVEMRREPEMLMDRATRIFGEQFARLETDIRFVKAKRDLTKAPVAARSAATALYSRMNFLFQSDEQENKRLFLDNIPSLALAAVARRDAAAVEHWLKMAHRLEPVQIQIPIDILPIADTIFDKKIVDSWFELYFDYLQNLTQQYPHDAMTLNNTAWMCALCGRRLEEAKEFSSKAVALRPDPTYLDTLAEIEFRLGSPQSAIAISQKCRELEPREDQHRKQIKRFFQALEKSKTNNESP